MGKDPAFVFACLLLAGIATFALAWLRIEADNRKILSSPHRLQN